MSAEPTADKKVAELLASVKNNFTMPFIVIIVGSNGEGRSWAQGADNYGDSIDGCLRRARLCLLANNKVASYYEEESSFLTQDSELGYCLIRTMTDHEGRKTIEVDYRLCDILTKRYGEDTSRLVLSSLVASHGARFSNVRAWKQT